MPYDPPYTNVGDPSTPIFASTAAPVNPLFGGDEPAIPTTNLANDWDAANGQGGTQFLDSVAAAHADFGVGGAAPTWQASPPAILLNGTSQYAQVPLARQVVFGAVCSVVAAVQVWFPGDAAIVWSQSGNILAQSLSVGNFTGRTLTASPGGATNFLPQQYSSASTRCDVVNEDIRRFAVGEWHTLAWIDDGQWWYHLVDCEIVAAIKINSTVPYVSASTATSLLTFGRDSNESAFFFRGAIGRVLHYTRPLSILEVYRIHAKLQETYTDLPDIIFN